MTSTEWSRNFHKRAEIAKYTVLELMNNSLKELTLPYVDDICVNKEKSVEWDTPGGDFREKGLEGGEEDSMIS